ncbi:hypothetical protein BDB01DRAFT_724951, partial [Pilobolus umbonatus]
YIKLRRQRTFLFLCIPPNSPILYIKKKLCEVLETSKTAEEVRLLIQGRNKDEYIELENSKHLETGSTVYYVYYDREEGQWEPVNIIEPELLDDDFVEEIPLPKKEKGKGRA